MPLWSRGFFVCAIAVPMPDIMKPASIPPSLVRQGSRMTLPRQGSGIAKGFVGPIQHDQHSLLQRIRAKLFSIGFSFLFLVLPFWPVAACLILSIQVLVILIVLFYGGWWFYTIYSRVYDHAVKGTWEISSFRASTWWQDLMNTYGWRIEHQYPIHTLKPKLFAAHPHGVLPYPYLLMHMVTTWTLNLVTLTSSVMFQIPFQREFNMLAGFREASHFALEDAIAGGRNVLVLPGGTRELCYSSRIIDAKGNHEVVIVKRVGFLKAALANGLDLVPVFGFGADETYRLWLIPGLVNFGLKYMKTPPFLLFGSFPNVFEPMTDRPVCVVTGKVITVEKNEEYTEDDVLKLSNNFYEEMSNLVKEHCLTCPDHSHVVIKYVETETDRARAREKTPPSRRRSPGPSSSNIPDTNEDTKTKPTLKLKKIE